MSGSTFGAITFVKTLGIIRQKAAVPNDLWKNIRSPLLYPRDFSPFFVSWARRTQPMEDIRTGAEIQWRED
jgi:hypothetical protein